MAQLVAVGWYVLDVTGQASAIGLLGAMLLASGIVGAPVGGWLVSRYSVSRLVSALSAAQAVMPILIGVLLWQYDIPIPILFAMVFIASIFGGLGSSGKTKLLVLAAPDENKPKMVADGALAYNVGRLVGPLLGSVLVAWVSVGAPFIFNGLALILLAAVAASTTLQPKVRSGQPEPPTRKDDQKRNYVSNIREGMVKVAVRSAILGALVFFLIVAPIQPLMPSIARTYGSHPLYLGILVACIAAGGVAANPLIRRSLRTTKPNEVVAFGLALAGPMLILLGFSHWLVLDMLLLSIIGAGWECLWLASQQALQLELPDDLSARMIGLFYAVVAGATSLGTLAIGALMDAIGVRNSLLAMGALTLAYGAVNFVHARRNTAANRSACETEVADAQSPA